MHKARMLFLLLTALTVAESPAQIQVPMGYTVESINANCGGGIDYLPGGDILGIYQDLGYPTTGYLVEVDANGDGVPSAPQQLYALGSGVYGSFVRVSPSGGFAIFGESSNGVIRHIDLSGHSVVQIATVAYNNDLSFIDYHYCYLSANPEYNPQTWESGPNRIYHWDLDTGIRTVVVEIPDTPSGPIDVDDSGNLYYVRGTGAYPPPPNSFALLKYSAAALAQALQTETALGENDAQQIALLDGGYKVAWHSSGYCFVSDSNNGKIYKIESDGTVSTFCERGGGSYDSYTGMDLYRRDSSFGPCAQTAAKLCVVYSDWSSVSAFYQLTSTILYIDFKPSGATTPDGWISADENPYGTNGAWGWL